MSHVTIEQANYRPNATKSLLSADLNMNGYNKSQMIIIIHLDDEVMYPGNTLTTLGVEVLLVAILFSAMPDLTI